jgi:hypothetical protein
MQPIILTWRLDLRVLPQRFHQAMRCAVRGYFGIVVVAWGMG